ncbi:MAG: thioredoxin [Gemmatimonadales bacterium]
MTIDAESRPVTVRCPFCETMNRIDLLKLDRGPKCGECGRPLHLDRPLKATGADFDQAIAQSSVPVVVDFYADWCGPCRMMAPVLDTLAADRLGEVLVLKVDTDRDPELSQRFGVRGIPTVIAFSGGRELGRHVGVASRTELDGLIRRA